MEAELAVNNFVVAVIDKAVREDPACWFKEVMAQHPFKLNKNFITPELGVDNDSHFTYAAEWVRSIPMGSGSGSG